MRPAGTPGRPRPGLHMDRFITALARLTAQAGGLVLGALVLMTCASIVGRALAGLGLGPVPGDFELVEAGIAFTVFAFLPWCSVTAGHATVDVFTNGLGLQPNRVLLAVWEVVMALAVALLAWRLYEGAIGKVRNGEITLFLQFPIWWAYVACLAPACITVLVALWSAFDRIRGAITGQDTRAVKTEAQH